MKEWNAIDGSIRAQFKKKLAKVLVNPHVPANALSGELAGLYKIKLSTAGYRLVYSVADKEVIVTVVAVGRRDAEKVYKEAALRLGRE